MRNGDMQKLIYFYIFYIYCQAADDIGAYVYERTLKMEERTRILQRMNTRKVRNNLTSTMPSCREKIDA